MPHHRSKFYAIYAAAALSARDGILALQRIDFSVALACGKQFRKQAGQLEAASCLLTSGLPSGWVLADRHLSAIASLEVLQHPLIHLERDSFLRWIHVLDGRGGLR